MMSIAVISTFWSCHRERSIDRYKAKLEHNRKVFEKEAEAFFKQEKIKNIARTGDRTFNIEGDIIVLRNQNFNVSTLNINHIEIEKHEIFENFDHFLAAANITRNEFFRWADFLKRYDLFALSIDSRLVFIGFRGGLVGSESGLFYVPKGSEDAVNFFYPQWPPSMDYVEKIDERWYYYVE